MPRRPESALLQLCFNQVDQTYDGESYEGCILRDRAHVKRPRSSQQSLPRLGITTLRLDRPGVGAALGDLEAELMELVWRRPTGDAVTVREVWQELYPTHPVMYTTVMNTMTRLAKKGLLVAERKGIAFSYTAPLTRDAFVDRFVGGALERLLANFSGATRAQLERVDDPALQARLAKLLDDVASRRTGEQGR